MNYKLLPHQEKVFSFFKDKHCGAMFLDPGLGKTFVSIELMKHNNINSAIIFGPSAVQRNWELEIEKFWPECKLPVHVSYGGSSKRKKDLEKFLEKGYGILILNYEIMSSTLKDLVHQFNAKMLILDESHLVKSYKSKRAKEINKLRQKIDKCFLLTGTPILQNITDVYMQYLIMDGGKTFGNNFFVFQRKYMKDKNEHWKGSTNYFPNWVVNPKMMDEFKEKLAHTSVFMKKEDVLDLPPLIEKNYYVKLNKEQNKIYKELATKLVSEIREDEKITVENALTKILRLNQICAGHLSNEGEVVYKFENIEKVKVLKDIAKLVHSLNEKIIIWCAFKEDIKTVTKALNDLKFKGVCYITGQETTKQKAESMRIFDEDPEVRFCVANLSAGGTGINLIPARHSTYFSLNYKLGDLLQSWARNNRKGSEIHSSLIRHNIITEGSIEEEIMKALMKKKKIGDDLLNNLEKLKEVNREFKRDILSNFIKGE